MKPVNWLLAIWPIFEYQETERMKFNLNIPTKFVNKTLNNFYSFLLESLSDEFSLSSS